MYMVKGNWQSLIGSCMTLILSGCVLLLKRPTVSSKVIPYQIGYALDIPNANSSFSGMEANLLYCVLYVVLLCVISVRKA